MWTDKPGIPTVADLGDVDLTGIADGDILVWDDGTLVPAGPTTVLPAPVAWQDTPTAETLRDALVTLGLMEPDGS